MGRCCGNRGRATQPTPTHSTSDGRMPQGVNTLMGTSSVHHGTCATSGSQSTIMGQSKVCSKCGGPMRVLHQYSSGGVNIQAYSCMVCSSQEDVRL